MDELIIQGIRTHNLKNFDLKLKHNRLYVVTGVSGSGKSSLAFDTLYAEGQRRYVESLSAYSRQFLERMEKPDIESIQGIRPAIAIEAKNVINNARSTVGTQTEINDYLRVFFSRIGRTYCPACDIEVRPYDPESCTEILLSQYSGKEILVLFHLSLGERGREALKDFLPELERQGFTELLAGGSVYPAQGLTAKKVTGGKIHAVVDRLPGIEKNRKRLLDSLEQAFRFGKGRIGAGVLGPEKKMTVLEFSEELSCVSCSRTFRKPSPNLFSFNSPLGACPACQGFGRIITIDWNLVIPDPRKTLAGGVIEPWSKPGASWEFGQMKRHCKRAKIPLDIPWKDLSEEQRDFIVRGRGPWKSEKDYFSVQDYFDYLEKKTYKMHVRIFLSKYRNFVPCPQCRETRLKADALCVRIQNKNIFELQSLSLSDLAQFFRQLSLSRDELGRVEPVYQEIRKRLDFLNEVGLGYLNLARLSRTLSGGEVQRIHLASALGSSLEDTLYVLDEPSIGLHERDNQLLIRLLMKLRDLRNTVVVVEHDRTMIEAADEVLDIGPSGGEKGGHLIFQGSVEALKADQRSFTGKYLAGNFNIVPRPSPKGEPQGWIKIRGAEEHNLKRIDVDIPLNRLVVITGVSGSGKSTLAYNILYHQYLRYRGRPIQDVGKVRSVRGFEGITEMALIDQSPIGRSARSNPATYIKAYDEIRKAFARAPEALRRGYGPSHFSFNVEGGRCPVCKREGQVKVDMHFLADIYVPCEECQGKRFKKEVLEIRYQGKNCDDVLGMTIEDAFLFFSSDKRIRQKLSILMETGLGYLRLGQAATTLSGGEAQRLKLACEMSESASGRILYLFDEPTTGLHYHDIHYLMKAFYGLLGRGHSLVIIEHNMEVIASADYAIDLGPEGGDLGGNAVYQGPVEGMTRCKESYTGECLKKYKN